MKFYKLTAIAACLAAAAALALPASAQEKTKLRVMGMPLSTGNILKNREQPFFENFAKKTGLPIEMDYKPLDSTGIKEFEQLRVIKTGLFDIVGLRMGQVSRDEPTILGLDLVGLNTDYKMAKKVVTAYQDFVDLRLQQQFNTKLLGVWPFGPQIIFCKPVIKDLSSLKGLKVRILDGVMAKFMEKVGATPVTMAFGEVAQALSLGTIDCAVTGPSSANSAGWPESATHVYALGLQVAVLRGAAAHRVDARRGGADVEREPAAACGLQAGRDAHRSFADAVLLLERGDHPVDFAHCLGTVGHRKAHHRQPGAYDRVQVCLEQAGADRVHPHVEHVRCAMARDEVLRDASCTVLLGDRYRILEIDDQGIGAALRCLGQHVGPVARHEQQTARAAHCTSLSATGPCVIPR